MWAPISERIGMFCRFGELLQNLGIRGVTSFGLSYGRNAHLLEEDLPQLLRGSDVEGVADLFEDSGFELLYPLLYLPPDLLKCRDFHWHPKPLHLPQNVRERQLYVVVEARETHLFQLVS